MTLARLAGPMVAVDRLVKHFALAGSRRSRFAVKAVDDVSFRIAEGEVLGLVGESGSGKSTIARLLTRLMQADAGKITIAGQDLMAMGADELRRFRPVVQLVFQDPYSALDPRMRIGVSLEAPLAQHRIDDRIGRRKRVLRMLAEVGLDGSFYERLPKECSGGQLQRAVIARALLLNPRVLICDEPTSALDASMRAQILNLLVQMKQRYSLTVLMISHDLRVIRYLCDRIAVMYLGQIVELADRETLFATPAHPYTRALIASSMLESGGIRRDDDLIRGEPPSVFNPPSGCRFHSRCPVATDRCTREAPSLDMATPGHEVRCHYWREVQATALPTLPRHYGPDAAAPAP